MARIRTIKPEFFTSEDIVSLSPLARLFYIGLWCEADRDGRMRWKPKTLKMRYLPGDNCDIQTLENELTSTGLIAIYEADGRVYAEIPSFKNHQIINNRETESIIPPRVLHASPRVKAEGRKEGREGKGREGMEGTSEALPSGVKTPLSANEIIFGYGLPMLTNSGTPEKQARSFLGGLRKNHGDDALIDKLRACIRERPLQPLEWLAKALPPGQTLNAQEKLEKANNDVLNRFLEKDGYATS